jgi:Ca2+-binding RTX toxin-like protein
MLGRVARRWAVLALLTLALLAIHLAVAAPNTVAATAVDDQSLPVSANDLKPPECAALNLINLVAGNGTINGTNANDMILGSAGNDRINARRGDDCLLGDDGNDRLRGRQGNDILLGMEDNDLLRRGRGTDICDGGAGVDRARADCETVLNVL